MPDLTYAGHHEMVYTVILQQFDNQQLIIILKITYFAVCVCAVEGVKDSWTATNENKRVAVIVSSPQNDPSVWRNNVLRSLATQALHHPYHPAAATD